MPARRHAGWDGRRPRGCRSNSDARCHGVQVSLVDPRCDLSQPVHQLPHDHVLGNDVSAALPLLHPEIHVRETFRKPDCTGSHHVH